MPLFGKKNSEKKDEKKPIPSGEKSAYPKQPAPVYPQQPYQQQHPGAPPSYTATMGVPAPGPSTTVVVGEAFDAGARFGAGATPNIPPPPPGIMPNMAQIATAQGNNVVVGQKKETIMGGTGDAGYVVW